MLFIPSLALLVACGRIGYEDTLRSRIDGKHWLGANLPWRSYGFDFGGGAEGGASSEDAQAEIEPAFASAAAGGLRVVRWAMFTHEGIPYTTDADGLVTGFDPAVTADLDAAIALAARYDLHLMLVVFMDQAPGADTLADPARREAVAAAVGGLANHAVSRGNRVSWSYWPSTVFTDDERAMTYALAAAIGGVGARFSVLVPAFEDLAAACDAGADFVGLRATADGPCPHCTTYGALAASYTPSCPVSIDVAFAPPGQMPRDLLDSLYERGYAATLLWSLLPARTDDLIEIDLDATAAFAATRGDIGPR